VSAPSKESASRRAVVAKSTSSCIGVPLAEGGARAVRGDDVGAQRAAGRSLKVDSCLTADEHVFAELLSLHPKHNVALSGGAGAKVLNESVVKFDRRHGSLFGGPLSGALHVDCSTVHVRLAVGLRDAKPGVSTSLSVAVDDSVGGGRAPTVSTAGGHKQNPSARRWFGCRCQKRRCRSHGRRQDVCCSRTLLRSCWVSV
jgi:hypothetical protein